MVGLVAARAAAHWRNPSKIADKATAPGLFPLRREAIAMRQCSGDARQFAGGREYDAAQEKGSAGMTLPFACFLSVSYQCGRTSSPLASNFSVNRSMACGYLFETVRTLIPRRLAVSVCVYSWITIRHSI